MAELNYETWKRREAYEFFSRLSNPFFMVTFRQDVTGLYDYVKKNGSSFYNAMIWCCTEALNQIEAFRVTKRDGKLLLLDRRNPSFTVLKPGAEQFSIVTMEHIPDITRFCAEAAKKIQVQTDFIDPEKETDDLIYYSCLPWLDLTALTNERDMQGPGALDDSIPRIAWGKFTEENGRKKLGISVEVNHRFIDGFHIGQFAQRLDEIIEKLH